MELSNFAGTGNKKLESEDFARFNLSSFVIIAIIFIFSLIRFSELPQWIDGYYHLSVTNGFVKSGGWTPWAWWDSAPLGKPHLYPPLYHLILVLLTKIGLTGLNAVRATEVLITPLFFISIWHVSRRLINARFAFFALLCLSSFFIFYSSVSANVPASMALLFGLLAWLAVINKKVASGSIMLALSFYTHSGIPWIFAASLATMAILNQKHRTVSLKILLWSLFLASPFLYHEVKYLDYLSVEILREVFFTHFSIFILSAGVISLFFHIKKGGDCVPLFLGYVIGSVIVFSRYPYRLFSAQGIVGFAFFASLLMERIVSGLEEKKSGVVIIIIAIILAVSHPTIKLDAGKPMLDVLNSTYFNLFTGKAYSLRSFKAFIVSQFIPIAQTVKENTAPNDIISSNFNISAQIFSALTGRATSNSMLKEVIPGKKRSPYDDARVIVWAKSPDERFMIGPKNKAWKKIYDDNFAYVYLNPQYKASLEIPQASVKFRYIFIISLAGFAFLVKDNITRLNLGK